MMEFILNALVLALSFVGAGMLVSMVLVYILTDLFVEDE